MAVLHGRTILLAAQVMGAGLKAGHVVALVVPPPTASRRQKMAAAEEGCGVGVEADRELEELLESKSPGWKSPEVWRERTHCGD